MSENKSKDDDVGFDGQRQKKYGLNPGDKYLTIQLDLGLLGKKNIALFKNEDWTAENNQPLYKSRDGAAWISEKREDSGGGEGGDDGGDVFVEEIV